MLAAKIEISHFLKACPKIDVTLIIGCPGSDVKSVLRLPVNVTEVQAMKFCFGFNSFSREGRVWTPIVLGTRGTHDRKHRQTQYSLIVTQWVLCC